MASLRTQGDEIPKHVRILEMGHRVPLLSVDKTREEERISDEENRSVVSSEIPETFVGVKLDCETTGITSSVCATALSTWFWDRIRGSGEGEL